MKKKQQKYPGGHDINLVICGIAGMVLFTVRVSGGNLFNN